MYKEIAFALLQAATEFLPISSSGHLAIISNLVDKPDLAFFTLLHLASLFAVIIFARKELWALITFNKEYRMWWPFLIIASIPAALAGFFFTKTIEVAFTSYLSISAAYLFTGLILYKTRTAPTGKKLTAKKSLNIGLLQALALFPGISRSGMTIAAASFQGINREKAVKFSFLLIIPLVIGAVYLEGPNIDITPSIAVAFFVCLFSSLLFLNLLTKIIKNGQFWLFSFYCFFLSVFTLMLHVATR